MLKRWMKNQKGFTLVELLAVIVILGIIAAIAIPAIGHIINKTDDKAKVSEAVQIIDAAKLYVASEGIDSDTDLDYTKLGDYLDNVDDTGYKVHVTFKNGHADYSISGHDAVGIVNKGDPVSEKDLLDYLGKNASSSSESSGQ